MNNYKLWDSHSENYSKDIFSITQFPRHVENIVKQLRDNSQILIIGAGSEIYLQKEILNKYPNNKIIISDFSPNMLKESKKKFNHQNLSFEQIDMTNIEYQNKFDYILSTNSILLSTIESNNLAFKEINKALKKNGKLIAYLVSFDATKEVCGDSDELKKYLCLSLENQSICDSGETQSYHTIESIEYNLRFNFRKEHLDKIYLNTPEELSELSRLYHLPIDDCKKIFEYFLVCSKNS